MVKFEMDKAGMKKFEKEVQKEVSAQMEQILDRTFAATAGKSEEIVRTQLRAEAKKTALDLNDKAVRDFAKIIAAGERPSTK